jgi:hypothetical protein
MLRQRVDLILLGGAAFWVPTTAIELVTRQELNILIGTFLGPAALLSTYLGLALWRRRDIRAYLWMLIGLYSLGSWFMFIAFTRSGGGFASIHRFADVYILFLSTVVPILTLVFSGYDGTLCGVLLITVLLPCVHYLLSRRWQIRDSGR